jgi:DNA invertase Pin-like site-specific DNA recombinase
MRSERTKDGMIQCLNSGRFPHRAKIGYLNTTDLQGNKKIILDPDRAKQIKYLLEAFSKGIYTQEELRQTLNKQGFKTREGNPLSFQMVNKILTSKFYTGIMVIKGKEYQGSHEPLITELTYYKNQKLLRNKKSVPSLSITSDFALRNYALCGDCLKPLTAGFSTGKLGGRYAYYRCYNKQCPTRKSFNKDKLEAQFIKLLEDITPTEENLTNFKKKVLDYWTNQYININKKNQDLEKQLSELQTEKTQILSLAKKQLISDDDFKEEFDLIKQKITDTQLLLQDTVIEDFDIQEALDFVITFIRQISTYWAKSDYTKRVKLQGLIFKKNPVFTNPTFATPTLTSLFNTKQYILEQNSTLVALRRVGLRFSG